MESYFIENKYTKRLICHFILPIINLKLLFCQKCLNSVFKVIFSDLTIVNLLQTFESAVQENVSINGQAWQEASDKSFIGM